MAPLDLVLTAALPCKKWPLQYNVKPPWNGGGGGSYMLSCATTHSALCELKQMRRSASLCLKARCLYTTFCQESFELNSPPASQCSCADVKTVAELDVVLKPLRWGCAPSCEETFIWPYLLCYNFPLFGRGAVLIIMFSKPSKSFIPFHGQKLWSFIVAAWRVFEVLSTFCFHSAFKWTAINKILNSIVLRRKSAFCQAFPCCPAQTHNNLQK